MILLVDPPIPASAIATVSETITAINVTNPGGGYVDPPLVTVTGVATPPFVPTAISGTGGAFGVVTATYANHGLTQGQTINAAGSSTPGYNASGVVITFISSSQFSYPGTGTGTAP